MQNYLFQLALRVQQPELAIQPRPLSLFESPDYSNPEWLNPGSFRELHAMGSGESHESLDVLPFGRLSAEQSIDRAEGIRRKESRSAKANSHDGAIGMRDQSYQMSGTDHSISRAEDCSRPALIPEARWKGKVDQSSRRSLEDRTPVSSRVTGREGAEHRSSGVLEDASAKKPGQDPFPRTDRAIRAAEGRGVNEAHGVRPPVPAVRPVPAVGRRQAVFDIQGVQEEGGIVQHIARINQYVAPPLRGASSSTVSVLRPNLERQDFRTDHVVVPQHEVSHVNPSLEGKSNVASNDPSRPRRERFASPVDLGEVRHAVDRETPSPTIQVSIGRIEVRASVASAPAKKVQTRSSAMSLDEYLTRRNEGRR